MLDIVDEPMNGSSYAQCATPRYVKTVQFSSVNLDAHVKSPFYMDLGIQEFRNCELLQAVSAKGITQNP